MFKFFRRHRTVVMISLVFCTLGLLLFGIGGTSFMQSPRDAVAKVNGNKITGEQFERVYRVMSQQKPDASAKERQQMLGQAFNELIRQEVLSNEAERYGISVSDEELMYQLAAVPAFQRDSHFDEGTYRQIVQRVFGQTPADFEKDHRKDVAVRKLNLLIASAVQVSDAEINVEKDSFLSAEKDPKAREKLQSDPKGLRDAIRDKQINLVFADWLNRLNSQLKVTIVSDAFRQRLNGGAVSNAPGGAAAPAGNPNPPK
ncbi:MAG: SurA N-terminal domain-containing protein [Elusimicrobia bacterium]|nr:SurA N-terminal domain-containing protein [Elusimicrobiota bacterium]